jgi:hypothetical protein
MPEPSSTISGSETIFWTNNYSRHPINTTYTSADVYPYATFPASFPLAVAEQLDPATGEALAAMTYQEGMSAIFDQLGWRTPPG